MNGPVRGAVRVAWYRFRATFRRRWSGYLALAVLIGLVGGVAMGSVIAARRTDSSYPNFLASTNPSDLIVVSRHDERPTRPIFVRQLARLPHVRDRGGTDAIQRGNPHPAGRDRHCPDHPGRTGRQPGRPVLRPGPGDDRARRAANPARSDEVVATTEAAARARPARGVAASRSGLTRTVREDHPLPPKAGPDGGRARRAQHPDHPGRYRHDRTGFLIGTPALAREYGSCCASE